MARSDVTATTHREPKPKKEFSHLEVKHAENGGHIVTHHFTHFNYKPEDHVFGDGEGGKMLGHVGKVMGVPGSEEEAGEPQHAGKIEE